MMETTTTTTTATFALEGLTCSSCSQAVTGAIRTLSLELHSNVNINVQDTSVNARSNTIEIEKASIKVALFPEARLTLAYILKYSDWDHDHDHEINSNVQKEVVHQIIECIESIGFGADFLASTTSNSQDGQNTDIEHGHGHGYGKMGASQIDAEAKDEKYKYRTVLLEVERNADVDVIMKHLSQLQQKMGTAGSDRQYIHRTVGTRTSPSIRFCWNKFDIEIEIDIDIDPVHIQYEHSTYPRPPEFHPTVQSKQLWKTYDHRSAESSNPRKSSFVEAPC